MNLNEFVNAIATLSGNYEDQVMIEQDGNMRPATVSWYAETEDTAAHFVISPQVEGEVKPTN